MVTKQQVQTDANQFLMGKGHAPLSPEELEDIFDAVAGGAVLGEVLGALLRKRQMQVAIKQAQRAAEDVRDKPRRRNP